jgi:ankyrin repeat protein
MAHKYLSLTNGGVYRTALHVASAEGHEEVVSLLLAFGATVDAIDRWGHSAIDEGMLPTSVSIDFIAHARTSNE